MKARVKVHGNIWLNLNYITNVLSLWNITNKFLVTYYSAYDNDSVVRLPVKLYMSLIMHSNGLHT